MSDISVEIWFTWPGALNYFTESCHKLYLREIDRHDLLKFSGFLRGEKKQSPRSVYNKFEIVMTSLKANGIRGLVGRNDWPRYTEEEPEMYEEEELDKLFKSCNEQERLWFEFFLMTGMREQEVKYTYWSDVNFAASTVRVTHTPDRNRTPRAYKEGEIPIPAKLVKKLKASKAKADKTCGLVFPTSGCNPKLDFLDCLKACAERSELDKDDFWLHKFRSTFATRCLWAGVDLRTVQHWLGHSDMESTMRYLKPSRSQHVRNQSRSKSRIRLGRSVRRRKCSCSGTRCGTSRADRTSCKVQEILAAACKHPSMPPETWWTAFPNAAGDETGQVLSQLSATVRSQQASPVST